MMSINHSQANDNFRMNHIIKQRQELVREEIFNKVVEKFENLPISEKVEIVKKIVPFKIHIASEIQQAHNEMCEKTTCASMKNMIEKIPLSFCEGRFYLFVSKNTGRYLIDILNMSCCRLF